MSYTPTLLDVKTDILRSIFSSYSKNGLKDRNFKYFLRNAMTTLDKLNLDEKKKKLVAAQIRKTKETKKDINKIREDILLIASII